MALKFVLLVVLLIGAGIYGAPTFDEEDVDMDDQIDTEIPDEDETQQDDEDDVEKGQEALKDESTPSKDSKKKFRALLGKDVYCVCKVAVAPVTPKPKTDVDEGEIADEPMTEEDLFDQLDQVLDPITETKTATTSKSKKAALAAYEKKLHDLIKGYFGQRNLYCYCTKNKMVLKLIRLLHSLKWFANKTKQVANAVKKVEVEIKNSQKHTATV